MRIGLFLDVDGVLTQEVVNIQYARLLGVEQEILDIEDKFSSGRITNDQFNETFVPLFRNAGFSRELARKHIDDKNIRMRIGYQDLLNLPVEVFLVSSGPDYFLDSLVENHKIIGFVCSKYEFDKDAKGLLKACTRPSSSATKADFVKQAIAEGRYDLTIGVGDQPPLDGQFLQLCDIPILFLNEHKDYPTIKDSATLVRFVKNLIAAGDRNIARRRDLLEAAQKFERMFAKKKVILILSPFRWEDARFREIRELIVSVCEKNGFEAKLASDHQFDRDLWRNVEVYMNGVVDAIAVFVGDDQLNSPGAHVINANVLIEVGYMRAIGKEPMILKEERVSMPTDFKGLLYSDFKLDDDKKILGPRIEEWLKGK